MSLEASKKILKIFGILCIIFSILGIIIAIAGLAGGGLMASTGDDTAIGVGAVAIIFSVFLLISGVISLLEGIFSVRAAKDTSKIMPAWVFAIIDLVLRVVGLIMNFKNGTSSIVSSVIGLGIGVLIFVAANTIKKSA